MKNFKTNLEQEWYILTPINIGGVIPRTNKGVFYGDSLEIETFQTEEDYLTRCEELGIEIEER